MPTSLPPARKTELLRALSAGRSVEELEREGLGTGAELRALFLEAARLFEREPARTPWKIYVDGASRNNPGLSATGVVIRDATGAVCYEEGTFLGIGTNNEAEYQALLQALAKARELGAGSILIHSDSELLVRQMTGRYRVKEPRLQKLHRQALVLAGAFGQVRYVHIPRAENHLADGLANQALDEYISSQR